MGGVRRPSIARRRWRGGVARNRLVANTHGLDRTRVRIPGPPARLRAAAPPTDPPGPGVSSEPDGGPLKRAGPFPGLDHRLGPRVSPVGPVCPSLVMSVR